MQFIKFLFFIDFTIKNKERVKIIGPSIIKKRSIEINLFIYFNSSNINSEDVAIIDETIIKIFSNLDSVFFQKNRIIK
jgi:hypothetical protein